MFQSHTTLGSSPKPRHLCAGWICAALVGLVLLAGLWPLRFSARNNAGWEPGAVGLRFPGGETPSKFDPGGIVFTLEPLTAPAGVTVEPGALTLELWLRPAKEPEGARGRILSVCDPEGWECFFVGQWRTQLLIWAREPGPANAARFRELEVRNALATGRVSFVTLTSDRRGTVAYVEGLPAKGWPNTRLLAEPMTLAGTRLYLGNSAEGVSPWAGEVLGLSVRGRALTAEQVLESRRWWTNDTGRTPPFPEALLALYDLRRDQGRVIPSAGGLGNSLVLPERIREQKPRLAAPGEAWWRTGDFALNVLGFVPLGFCLAGWLRQTRPFSGWFAALAAIAAGALLSLAIEVLQVALPTRDSSLADLLGNTAGTLLGALAQAAWGPRTNRAPEDGRPPVGSL